VRAVELRLRRLKPPALESALAQADADGFVLVRPMVRELIKFEQAEPAMSFYYPEFVHGIDIAEETRRIATLQFAPADPVSPARAAEGPGSAAPAAALSELDQWLAEGERQIAAKDVAAAEATYNRILARYPGQPRAVYGLGVAAILQGDATRAKQIFLSLIQSQQAAGKGETKSDVVTLAWSHVYLGRIYDVDGNRELAMSEYRAALAVEGAPEAARMAARRGLERGYDPAAQNREPAKQRP
jgi:tetratricopeptide (TPR) repeat protein